MRKAERERERNTDRSPPVCSPNQGLNPQPSDIWEDALTGRAILARVSLCHFYNKKKYLNNMIFKMHWITGKLYKVFRDLRCQGFLCGGKNQQEAPNCCSLPLIQPAIHHSAWHLSECHQLLIPGKHTADLPWLGFGFPCSLVPPL